MALRGCSGTMLANDLNEVVLYGFVLGYGDAGYRHHEDAFYSRSVGPWKRETR